MYNIKTFLFIILFAYMVISITGLNEKQMKAAVKLVTNVCLPKSKATVEDIEKMHKGDWDVDHTTMCTFKDDPLLIIQKCGGQFEGETIWRCLKRRIHPSPLECFMFCALNSYKLFNKDNTFNYDSALQQIGQLPESYKESAKLCTDQCRDAAVTLKDKCIAAHEVAKCVYFCNPEKYFLP